MRLKAVTKSEISVILSLIQDSITCFKWMYFGKRSFSCLLNRYAWEKEECLRVQSLLTVKNIDNVFQSVSTKFKFFYLESANITQDDLLEIKFSNNNYITVSFDDINILLENTSEYYQTIFKPYSYKIYENAIGRNNAV